MTAIAPSAFDRAACHAAIKDALDDVVRFRKTDMAVAALNAKDATEAVKAHHKALVQARRTYLAMLRTRGDAPTAPGAGRRWQVALLDALIEATKPVPKRVVTSPALRKDHPAPDVLPLAVGEVLSVRAGAAKPMSTMLAREMLERFCPDKHIPTTKGGRWHKLAAILYGDPRADLYQYLLKYFHALK